MEIAMAATIAYLVIFKPFIVTRETIRRTPVPQRTWNDRKTPWHALRKLIAHAAQVPRKIYTFQDNPRYVRGDMWFNESLTLHTLHNWIELSSGNADASRET